MVFFKILNQHYITRTAHVTSKSQSYQLYHFVQQTSYRPKIVIEFPSTVCKTSYYKSYFKLCINGLHCQHFHSHLYITSADISFAHDTSWERMHCFYRNFNTIILTIINIIIILVLLCIITTSTNLLITEFPGAIFIMSLQFSIQQNQQLLFQ